MEILHGLLRFCIASPESPEFNWMIFLSFVFEQYFYVFLEGVFTWFCFVRWYEPSNWHLVVNPLNVLNIFLWSHFHIRSPCTFCGGSGHPSAEHGVCGEEAFWKCRSFPLCVRNSCSFCLLIQLRIHAIITCLHAIHTCHTCFTNLYRYDGIAQLWTKLIWLRLQGISKCLQTLYRKACQVFVFAMICF